MDRIKISQYDALMADVLKKAGAINEAVKNNDIFRQSLLVIQIIFRPKESVAMSVTLDRSHDLSLILENTGDFTHAFSQLVNPFRNYFFEAEIINPHIDEKITKQEAEEITASLLDEINLRYPELPQLILLTDSWPRIEYRRT